MQRRRGVSLVEVLVAAVLLAVGVAGTMNAVVAAVRLRVRADARETAARTVEGRLAWFQRAACAGTDSLEVIRVDGTIEEAWRITRAGGTARLNGRASVASVGAPVRLALTHERRCP